MKTSRLYAALAATLALGPAVLATTAAPARAADDFADWSCNALYAERNGIYKAAGYCFKTKKAINLFGNAGCQYDDLDDVPLSPNQRKVVARMRAVEKAKGC